MPPKGEKNPNFTTRPPSGPNRSIWRRKLANSGTTSSGAPTVFKPKGPAKLGAEEEKPMSPPATERIQQRNKCKVCSKSVSAAAMEVKLEQRKNDLRYSPGMKQPPNQELRFWEAPAVARLREKQTLSRSSDLPNYLFMFFSFPTRSSIAYQLYAANLQESGVQSSYKGPQTVEKVVSFPSDCLPFEVCCVQLDSKLYFLGGDRFPGDMRVEWNEHPRQVYVLEPYIILHKSGSIGGRASLKKVSPMNTGKPAPFALAAKGKIFIVSPIEHRSSLTKENISRFEVFHPDKNIWEVLPEAPNLGRVYGHAEFGDKILLSVSSGEVFFYDVGRRYWGRVSPPFPFMGVAHFVDGIFYAYAAPLTELIAFTSSGTNDRRRCGFKLNTQQFDLGLDCSAEAEIPQRYSRLSRVIHRADELIHLGNRTFCCVKVYNERYGYTVKIAAFHARHSIKQDFLPDIFHVSGFSIPNIRGYRPEFLCLSDAFSVPFVQEEKECEVKVDMNRKTLWEILWQVEEDCGEDDDALMNDSGDEEEGVQAWIKRSADIRKRYGISTTPWGNQRT